ncbi:MAG: hypothetical protein J5698_01200 [Bacteroidaceae bacterium]|nr:hypothetical protein [Bacteroidaceae bacterium]
MKKSILLISLLTLFSACVGESENRTTEWQRRKAILEKEKLNERPTWDELNEMLKDEPFPGGNGDWIPMREPFLQEPDTIVDGIPYAHV